MPWFAISDGAAFHRKILKAGNEAIGAWARAGSWSSSPENLTEGWIPVEVAESIAPARVWDRLVGAELLRRDDERGGYVIRSYLDYNPSAEGVRDRREEIRAKRSEAGKKGNSKRWGSQSSSQEASQTDRKTVATHRPLPLPLPLPLGDPDPLLRAPARVESAPEPEPAAELTLGESFAAEEALPVGNLDATARELAAENNPFGLRCVSYLDAGTSLPAAMRAKLREIRDERAKPRPSAVRRTLTLSAEEQGLVACYVAAQRRIRREDVPQLELHGRAAQRLLPDLTALAASIKREGFAPTAEDVLAHKLEQYLRLGDPRLAEQGFPLGLVLARTDAMDLPRPRVKRERAPPPAETGPRIRAAPAIGPRPATQEAMRAAREQWGLKITDEEIAAAPTGTGP